MRILEVRERTVPIESSISNAAVNFSEMTVSTVAIIAEAEAGRRVVGFGFHSNGRYGVGGLLRERFIPRLLRAAPQALLDETGTNLDPARVWQVLMANEKPGGHGERAVAVGTLDMAIWDLVAKVAGVPLWRLLADRYNEGRHDDRVAVYAAGGYYRPDGTLGGLEDEIRRYLDCGYESVKIKVGRAALRTDLDRIEAAIGITGSGSRVAVDANACFDLDEAIEFGRAIAPYGLRWFEEPGEPHDFELQAELGRQCAGPFATGENLFATVEARNLIRYAGLNPQRDYLQFDAALSYGIVEYLRTLAMLEVHGWSRRRCITHGGNQMSLHLAAGLGLGGNEAYPEVFAPFGGFADTTPVEDGYVRPTDEPGIGIELNADLYQTFRELLS